MTHLSSQTYINYISLDKFTYSIDFWGVIPVFNNVYHSQTLEGWSDHLWDIYHLQADMLFFFGTKASKLQDNQQEFFLQKAPRHLVTYNITSGMVQAKKYDPGQ